jgi:hypothetical protein
MLLHLLLLMLMLMLMLGHCPRKLMSASYLSRQPYEGMNQHAICFNVVAYNLRPTLDPSNMPVFADLIQRWYVHIL